MEACPICLKSLTQKSIVTSCGHRFHTKCLFEWKKDMFKISNSRIDCPCCRHDLKDDKNYILYRTKNKGVFSLLHASNKLRNDKEFVNKLIEINKDIYICASLELQNSKDFILKIIKAGIGLQNIFPRFRDDIEIVLEGVTKNGCGLKHVSKRLKDNEDIVIAAMKNNYDVFKYASKRLQKSEEIKSLYVYLKKNSLLRQDYAIKTKRIRLF